MSLCVQRSSVVNGSTVYSCVPVSAINPLPVQGIGGGCPQASAYLARTVGGNEGGNATNVTNLICTLVGNGVWAKLDALHVEAQQNVTDAKLNLVGSNYNIVAVGSPVFVSYGGFQGFTTSSYLNTQFNPASAVSPNFTQNSASFGLWSDNAVAVESAPQMGQSAVGNAGESHIYNDFTDGSFYARVNVGSGGGSASPGGRGWFTGDRSSSSAVVPFYNGVAQTSQASTSQAPANLVFTVGSVSSAPPTATQEEIGADYIGGSLGSAQQAALYGALRTYMTAIGLP
jgi:hypothetical protein